MGYTICTVVTKEIIYKGVTFVQHYNTYAIIDVDGYKNIPFTEEYIKEILITHGK